MNKLQELRDEELRHASQQHNADMTSLNGQCQTTNESISKEFGDHFQNLFIRDSGRNSSQFNTYFADFYRLEATQVARCDVHIMEGIRQLLKTVRDK